MEEGFKTVPVDFKKLNIKTIVTTTIILFCTLWVLSFFTRDELLDSEGKKIGTIRKKYGWNNWTKA